jgi:hypothetical protein
MKKLLPMLLALLCACEPLPPLEPLPPAFRILSISPVEQNTLEAKDVTVKLDVEPRFLVDFNTRTARMIEKPELQLGTWKVPLLRYLGHGEFQGTVPPGLEVDTYDVRVSLGDGREATLSQAYTVTQYLSFWIEPISDQLQGQPFTITIHAEGTNAERFQGTVEVVVYKDGSELFPIPRAPFSQGVLRQEITIDAIGSSFNVRVTDDKGNSATSRSFQVISKN